MTNANKIVRLWPDTKERFDNFCKGNGPADRVLNKMMDNLGVPK